MCGLPRASRRQALPRNEEVLGGSRRCNSKEGQQWGRAGPLDKLSRGLERILSRHRLSAHALFVSQLIVSKACIPGLEAFSSSYKNYWYKWSLFQAGIWLTIIANRWITRLLIFKGHIFLSKDLNSRQFLHFVTQYFFYVWHSPSKGNLKSKWHLLWSAKCEINEP